MAELSLTFDAIETVDFLIMTSNFFHESFVTYKKQLDDAFKWSTLFTFTSPTVVSSVKAEGSVLDVSTSGADVVDASSTELGHCWWSSGFI